MARRIASIILAIATLDATSAVVCDEQYLSFILKKGDVNYDDISACRADSNYSFDEPQVPASGEILTSLCASEPCMQVLHALEGWRAECNLPNCSATSTTNSWRLDSSESGGNSSSSGSGSSVVSIEDITVPPKTPGPTTNGGVGGTAVASMAAVAIATCTITSSLI